MKIPVIDLFAGPGGLAEGFSSVLKDDKPVFDIKLSIEKDPVAVKTLQFRSFYRQFKKNGKEVPEAYYDVLREKDLGKRELLRKSVLNNFTEGSVAKKEAIKLELGKDDYSETDERIRQALGKNHRKQWLLIGGPPCQAYSLAGRSRMGGVNESDHRVFLYQEYLRIIAEHQPAVFVMENVKGLLSATLNSENILEKILKDLRRPSSAVNVKNCPDYEVYSFVKEGVPVDGKDYLIKSENYGIPQKRHRVIFLGIRKDVNVKPKTLIPAEYVPLSSVIGGLPRLRSSIGRTYTNEIKPDGAGQRRYTAIKDSDSEWIEALFKFGKEISSWSSFSDKEFRSLLSIPDDGIGSEFVEFEESIDDKNPLHWWYHDRRLNGVINHQSRSHLLEDLKRYLFSSLYAQKEGYFPRLEHFKKFIPELLPKHGNVDSGKFNDRFRVQMPEAPASTVTCHISKDGHYFIHYDPFQCRSLTVREAARIQTFKDNYLFCGSRTQQFHQVGNAVPPFLAKQLGEVVKNIFENL